MLEEYCGDNPWLPGHDDGCGLLAHCYAVLFGCLSTLLTCTCLNITIAIPDGCKQATTLNMYWERVVEDVGRELEPGIFCAETKRETDAGLLFDDIEETCRSRDPNEISVSSSRNGSCGLCTFCELTIAGNSGALVVRSASSWRAKAPDHSQCESVLSAQYHKLFVWLVFRLPAKRHILNLVQEG